MPWIETELRTARTRLRAFREDDKAAMIRLLTDREVRRYLGGPAGDEQVEAARTGTVGERWGTFCIADAITDDPLGGCSFAHWRGVLELSYELLPEHWGQGLAEESLSAALDWIWTNTDDQLVVAVTQTVNLRSIGLLRRLGFVADLEFEEFGAAYSQLRLMRPEIGPT